MDEYIGYFRVATTFNNVKDKQTNNMYVLNENLEVIGKIEDLARGERIYSVIYGSLIFIFISPVPPNVL